MEERVQSKPKLQVKALYEDLEKFLKSEDFEEDLKEVLQEAYPNYLNVLEKRRRDMDKTDHAVVIAGETSSGKTTLINKILGKKIFKDRNLESTATICKIRNSDKVRIIIEHISAETEVMDLTDRCNPETKEGERFIRNELKKLTDMTSTQRSKYFQSVDIGFPIPLLEGDTILVDTPGIGGSGEVTQKLMEYLPNALSFVFVINVGSAGGLQNDRRKILTLGVGMVSSEIILQFKRINLAHLNLFLLLPEILKSLTKLQIADEMPCFDPRDDIFVTNKWDTISKGDSDSEEENEETITWRALQSSLKKQWPSVQEEHIFKMSLIEVSDKKTNYSTEQFREFQKALKTSIGKTKNTRISKHLRFLYGLLKTIITGLQARLEANKMTEEEQSALTKKHQKRIDVLTKECIKVRDDLFEKIRMIIEDTAQTCYDYMSTEKGMKEIVNPPAKDPILNVPWHPKKFREEIRLRCSQYVENYLKSNHVTARFMKIQDETQEFYNRVCIELTIIETEWTDNVSKKVDISDIDETDISTGAVVGVVLATSPIWIPLLATGIALTVAFGSVTIAVSPFLLPYVIYQNRVETKRKIVDEEYDNFKSSVQSLICNQLESTVGDTLEKFIDKVSRDILFRRIAALKKMTRQLSGSRQNILAKKDLLMKNLKKAKSIEEKTEKIAKILNECLLLTAD